MSDERIARLEAKLAGLSGPARLGTLTELGPAYAERSRRAAPGSDAALADLNVAIAALDEAYGYMTVDDGQRGQVAGLLGWLLCTRYTFKESDADREAGIQMSTAALSSKNSWAIHRTMSRITLGHLHLSRLNPLIRNLFQDPAALHRLMAGHGGQQAELADADLAIDCFRQVLKDKPNNDMVTELTEGMLAVAEATRMLLGGADGGLDLQKMMAAMAGLQKVLNRFPQGGQRSGDHGSATFLPFARLAKIFDTPSIDRPAYILDEPQGPEPTQPRQRPTPPDPPARADRQQLRGALRDTLFGTALTQPIWAAATDCLHPDATLPAVDIVDEAVALAQMVVDTHGNPDSGADGGSDNSDNAATAVDWFMLAVTLCLRDRLDQGGDHADLLAGAECLLTAVQRIPNDHPATIQMLGALGAFLREDRPFGGLLDFADTFSDDVAGRIDVAIAAGTGPAGADLASLHALRCLCRAASATADFTRAAVPPDYPWRTVLRAATELDERL